MNSGILPLTGVTLSLGHIYSFDELIDQHDSQSFAEYKMLNIK